MALKSGIYSVNPDTLLASIRLAIQRKTPVIAALEFQTLDRQLANGGPLPTAWAQTSDNDG